MGERFGVTRLGDGGTPPRLQEVKGHWNGIYVGKELYRIWGQETSFSTSKLQEVIKIVWEGPVCIWALRVDGQMKSDCDLELEMLFSDLWEWHRKTKIWVNGGRIWNWRRGSLGGNSQIWLEAPGNPTLDMWNEATDFLHILSIGVSWREA